MLLAGSSSFFGDDLTLAVNRCVAFSLLRCKHCLALSQITTQLSPPANILASCGVTFSSAHTWNIQLHIKETFPLRALGLCDSLLYYSAHRNYISTAELMYCRCSRCQTYDTPIVIRLLKKRLSAACNKNCLVFSVCNYLLHSWHALTCCRIAKSVPGFRFIHLISLDSKFSVMVGGALLRNIHSTLDSAL